MTFFSHRPFFGYLPLHILILYTLFLLHLLYTPYIIYTLIYTPISYFFSFLHLTFYSRNNKYYVRLLLFRNSSLHAAFYHCTFSFITTQYICASLHVKTSPERKAEADLIVIAAELHVSVSAH